MVCSRQSIGCRGGLWRSCCPSCQIFGALRFEPKRSFLDSPRERRCSCAVDFCRSGTSSSNHEEERPPEPIAGFGSRAGTTNCDASGLGGFVRRYLSTRNLRITSNFFRCTTYLVSHSVLCHCSCQTTLTKRQWCQCTTKLTQVSSFSESHTSHGRARHQIRDWSESGRSRELLTPGTMTHAGRAASSPEIFRPFLTICLTFQVFFWPSSRSNSISDLHHWILRKKIFHIRAYDFGVQFSYNNNNEDKHEVKKGFFVVVFNLLKRFQANMPFINQTSKKTIIDKRLSIRMENEEDRQIDTISLFRKNRSKSQNRKNGKIRVHGLMKVTYRSCPGQLLTSVLTSKVLNTRWKRRDNDVVPWFNEVIFFQRRELERSEVLHFDRRLSSEILYFVWWHASIEEHLKCWSLVEFCSFEICSRQRSLWLFYALVDFMMAEPVVRLHLRQREYVFTFS